jgi:hypothetical protein
VGVRESIHSVPVRYFQLRVTPTMEAEIMNHVWGAEEIARLAD